MKKLQLAAVIAALLPAAPLWAEGNVENGQAQFARQCVSCHVIKSPEGETLAGRNARTGPNLYGIIGEAPASVEDFRFGAGLIAWGETGAVWDEETFVSYVMDPTGTVRAATGDNRARVMMAYSMRNEDEARDIWAYLVSLQPAEDAAAEAAAE